MNRNNKIYWLIKTALELKDKELIEIWKLGGFTKASRYSVARFLRPNDHKDYLDLPNDQLTLFLKGMANYYQIEAPLDDDRQIIEGIFRSRDIAIDLNIPGNDPELELSKSLLLMNRPGFIIPPKIDS